MSAVRPGGLPTLNLSHSLAANLLFYGYDYRAGPTVVDLVSGTSVGVTASALSTAYGTLNDYATGPTFASSAAIRTATAAGAYTWACQFYKTRTAISYATPFGRQANNAASQPFNNWDFEINPGGIGQTKIRATLNNNGLQDTISGGTATIADNTLETIVGTLSGPSSATASAYLNGNATPFTTSGSKTANSVNSGDNIGFGGGIGGIMWGAFWSRVLTTTEIATLHNDPYVLFVGAGAGAGGFLFAA